MTPYIKFNGVRSDALGLRLVSAEPFILPKRTRQREYIPGRLGSISSADFEMPAVGYRIRLAAMDADKSAVVSKMHSIASWALSARIMTVWHEPGHYYTGAVEGDSSFSMLSRRNGMIEIEFICDPPCRQRASIPAGVWFPELDKPIPEQLSDLASTDYAKAKTAAFTLRSAGLDNALPPALHLALKGTWTTLSIGGTLTITEETFALPNTYIYNKAATAEEFLAMVDAQSFSDYAAGIIGIAYFNTTSSTYHRLVSLIAGTPTWETITIADIACMVVSADTEEAFLNRLTVSFFVRLSLGTLSIIWRNSTTFELKRLITYSGDPAVPVWNDIESSDVLPTTLYIDCDAQEVYRLVAETRTPVKYSGDFPALNEDGELGITGTGFNLSTAYLLVIERG